MKTSEDEQQAKRCPECKHVFLGNGWDGIDAHWKAKHNHIMPYAEAWPLIKAEIYSARHSTYAAKRRCPECRHIFQGIKWTGIDAHWKAKHSHIMSYAEAWPLIKAGNYQKGLLSD